MRISNPVYFDLKKTKNIKDRNLLIISRKTRDGNVPVIKDKKTNVIFLKRYVTGKKYYQDIQLHDDRPLFKKSQKKMNKVLTSSGHISTPFLSDDLRRVNEFKKIIKNKDILDFGCGWGNFLSMIKNAKSKNAVEVGKEFLQLIKKNYKDINIKENIKDFNICFDYIFLFHTLHYLPHQIQILKEFKTKLKKKGKIIIEVPHANDLLMILDKFRNFTFCKEQLILHTENSLRSFLKKAGFRKITINYFQRYNVNNHLGWFIKNLPGGHNFYQNIFGDNSQEEYTNYLKQKKKTDTLIAIAEK